MSYQCKWGELAGNRSSATVQLRLVAICSQAEGSVAVGTSEGSQTSLVRNATNKPGHERPTPNPAKQVGDDIVGYSGETRRVGLNSQRNCMSRLNQIVWPPSNVCTVSYSMSVCGLGLGKGRDMPYRADFDKTLRKKSWLKRKYLEEKKSPRQIAILIGAAPNTVRYYLQKFGLPIRDLAESGCQTKYSDTLYDEQWLQERYVDGAMTARAIAKLVGCSNPTTVTDALRWHGIRVKSSAEQRSGRPRPEISEPGFRKVARKVCPDGPCVVCGEAGYVHHKDGNVRNNKRTNLERLCQPHHNLQHQFEAKVALGLTGSKSTGARDWRGVAIAEAIAVGISPIKLYVKGRKKLLKSLGLC